MSFFFGLFQFANIIGNLIAGALIDKIEKTTFYFVMGIIGLVGSLIFLMLRKPIIANDNDAQLVVNRDESVELKIIS